MSAGLSAVGAIGWALDRRSVTLTSYLHHLYHTTVNPDGVIQCVTSNGPLQNALVYLAVENQTGSIRARRFSDLKIAPITRRSNALELLVSQYIVPQF